MWVNPEARDEDLVFANNREATAGALALGRAGLPTAADVLEQRDEPWNPYFRDRRMKELDDDGTRAVVAIQRLQAAYADAVTRRDWDGRPRRCSSPTPSSTSTPAPATRSPSRVPTRSSTFIDQAIAAFAFFEFTILNATVESTATRPPAACTSASSGSTATGAWSEAYGLYRDRYRRRDGAWRIAGRRYSSLARRGPERHGGVHAAHRGLSGLANLHRKRYVSA